PSTYTIYTRSLHDALPIYQRKRASGEWKPGHDLWPVCGASPTIPGSVEWQWRANVFLSVRDSLRSSEPGELYECAGGERLGRVQERKSTRLNPRHITMCDA